MYGDEYPIKSCEFMFYFPVYWMPNFAHIIKNAVIWKGFINFYANAVYNVEILIAFHIKYFWQYFHIPTTHYIK